MEMMLHDGVEHHEAAVWPTSPPSLSGVFSTARRPAEPTKRQQPGNYFD